MLSQYLGYLLMIGPIWNSEFIFKDLFINLWGNCTFRCVIFSPISPTLLLCEWREFWLSLEWLYRTVLAIDLEDWEEIIEPPSTEPSIFFSFVGWEDTLEDSFDKELGYAQAGCRVFIILIWNLTWLIKQEDYYNFLLANKAKRNGHWSCDKR